MDSSHSVPDSLKESIASGIFIDTKFYAFSRRDALGRVGSPRPLYCNSRVLNTIPYLSALFSDGFSEGQIRDINEGFPSDSSPYTESYDYLSDSDLEDDEPEQSHRDQGSGSGISAEAPKNSVLGGLRDANEVEIHHTPNDGFARTGKVAVIRDIAAVTLEATIYFLYTGKITFAPLSSDPRHNLPAKARTGDWTSARPPSPSAKSIYRLADKYDIPTLKARAKEHIHANLTHCDIVDEVFSSFSSYFPEILSLQVSQLVSKMKEESAVNAKSETRKQLLAKITSLSQPQLARGTDALTMIWSGATGPLDLPALRYKSSSFAEFFPAASSRRVELALLKSISTGIFIDIQFHAYNAISNDLPLYPKPLFTSSILIGEWAPAIATQIVGIESQAVCLADGLADDYECLGAKLTDTPPKDEAVSNRRTKGSAGTTNRDAVILISGAWNTWRSLFCYAHTNEIAFAPLKTEIGSVVDVEAQSRQSCSPRSMYSLATVLGIENIKNHALDDIRSKLTTSNIVQELFTLFAANHTAVMEMELEFFRRNSTEQNPRSLVDHIQKMKSGEAPFFPATLGLIYDTLFSKVFPQPVASGSGLGGPSKIGKSATKRTFAVQKSDHVPCFGLTPTLSSRPQQGLYNRYSDSDSDSDSDYL